MCYWRRGLLLRVHFDGGQRRSGISRPGLRRRRLCRDLLLLNDGCDDAWTNCATTLLCPHLDGSKKNGNDKESKTGTGLHLSLIHISEPTRLLSISYAVFCLKKK